ncbi:hypothetical protein D9Q98_009836 [Chlorella vulgaris]|uniref:Uncharacterized protein n=1 Tax=Chlorella vulgaris TaxID=3077 RepID=A0A9D4TFL2_CHLVU|nr:hypothetical protein D9Q98_009836 [Chlorella vulgaris]
MQNEDIDRKRHKRDPFAAKYVSLATSEFGRAAPGHCQGPDQRADAGRSAVEAAATNVHVRVELIKTMKNALVKQTEDALKRSAAPPQRQRLGSRRHQTAAAAAAAIVGAGPVGAALDGQDAVADGDAGAAFYRDDLHLQFKQLLRGEQPPELRLAELQELLLGGGEGDATRLPDAQLILDVEAELAPPPFEDLLLQLFGEGDIALDATAQPADPASDEPSAAGLEAVVDLLRQHTAPLEQQGILQLLPAGVSSWGDQLAPRVLPPLPPYLQPQAAMQAPLQPDHHHHQQQQPASPGGQWRPATGVTAGDSRVVSDDAIQEADDGAPAWAAFEVGGSQAAAEAITPLPPIAAPLQLHGQTGAAAEGGVLLAYDDDQGQQAWCRMAEVSAAAGTSTAEELQGCGDGKAEDPWAALEHGKMGDGAVLSQQLPRPLTEQPAIAGAVLQPGGGHRVPVFPVRRRPPAPAQPEVVPESEGEEEWDDRMLQQVAELERAALLRPQQPNQEPQAQPRHQLPHQRHAPVFPNRAITQRALPPGAWPCGKAAAGAVGWAGASEGIEESDSEGDRIAGAAPRQGKARAAAVPAYSQRPALLLSTGHSAAVGGVRHGTGGDEDIGAEGVPESPLISQEQQRAEQHNRDQQAAHAVPVTAPPTAAHSGSDMQGGMLLLDLTAIDIDALRPSVLLRQPVGGKPKWKPVLDPESLLLPLLRPSLPPPPAQAPGAVAPKLPAPVHSTAAAAAAAAELMAGLTAQDLDAWDQWSQGDDGSGSGGEPAGQCQEAPPQPLVHGQPEEVQVEWDQVAADQPAVQQGVAAGSPARGTCAWRQGGVPAAQPVPAATVGSAGSLAAGDEQDVQVCFDDAEGQWEEEQQQQPRQQRAQQHPAMQTSLQAPLTAWRHSQLSQGTTSGWQQRERTYGADALWIGNEERKLLGSEGQDEEWGCAAAASSTPASLGDTWVEFEAPARDATHHTGYVRDVQEAGQRAWQDQAAGSPCSTGAAAAPAADVADPWAALEAEAAPFGADSAAQQVAGTSPSAALTAAAAGSASPQCQAMSEAWPSPTAMSAAAGCAAASDDDLGGGWGCDVEWEDCADDGCMAPAALQQAAVTSHPQAAAAAGTANSWGAEPQLDSGALTTQDTCDALDWEYDDAQEEVAAKPAAGAGRLLLARTPSSRTAAWQQPGPDCGAELGKRRHEEIGDRIIQALMEERRRDRVDLQPLLLQLSQRLTAGLAAPDCGAGSSGGVSLRLSAVRRECMQGGDPGTQASLQRYLMALLTAVHRHNSGPIGTAEEGEGTVTDGTGTSLAAVLASRQLRLFTPPGSSDVTITAL